MILATADTLTLYVNKDNAMVAIIAELDTHAICARSHGVFVQYKDRCNELIDEVRLMGHKHNTLERSLDSSRVDGPDDWYIRTNPQLLSVAADVLGLKEWDEQLVARHVLILMRLAGIDGSVWNGPSKGTGS